MKLRRWMRVGRGKYGLTNPISAQLPVVRGFIPAGLRSGPIQKAPILQPDPASCFAAAAQPNGDKSPRHRIVTAAMPQDCGAQAMAQDCHGSGHATGLWGCGLAAFRGCRCKCKQPARHAVGRGAWTDRFCSLPNSLWRGDLSPLGCVAALSRRPRSCSQTRPAVLRLLRSRTGINPLATGLWGAGHGARLPWFRSCHRIVRIAAMPQDCGAEAMPQD